MKCVKCGKKLKSNEKFCTYCGYYNDDGENENWSSNESEEDLLEENWYDEDVEAKEDDEVELEPVKKEKVEKPKKEKPKKEKIEKPKEEKVKKEKPKKEKTVKEIKIKEDNEVYDENEKYIEAYIGEDYKLIKKSPFNIWAFLLNWMYLLYRKLYITGIIGLVLTVVIALFFTKYLLIYFIITVIVLGFAFNKYYIYIVKRKVDNILKEYEGTDSFSLEKMCSEFGGVNTPMALIIYLVFLVVIVISILKPAVNTSHNTKFWKENSENEANCLSLVKLIYKKNTSVKLNEALCRVNKNSNSYDIYIKLDKDNKVVYEYYTTEKDYIVYKNNTEFLENLKKKKAENRITEEEDKNLSDMKMIVNNYETIHSNSLKEDKLIKAKKDKEEKLNYIFDREVIIR